MNHDKAMEVLAAKFALQDTAKVEKMRFALYRLAAEQSLASVRDTVREVARDTPADTLRKLYDLLQGAA